MTDTVKQGPEQKLSALSSEQLASLELVVAFGLATVQSGMLGYLPGLLPLVFACFARYIAHSEQVLKQIRKFLFLVEQQAGYQGYEHYSRSVVRPSHGGYGKALRDTFLLTECVATGVVLVRLWFDHLLFVGVPVLIIECVALALTFFWLRGK